MPPATKYWSGRGGVVLVNDPLDTSTRSPRRTTSAGSSSTAANPSRSSRPILDGDRPAWVGRPSPSSRPTAGPDPDRGRSGPGGLPGLHDPPTHAARRPRDPARGRAVRARHLRRRARRPRRLRRPDRVPEARGHRLLRRRRAQPHRGSRPRLRRASGASRRRRWSSRGPPSRSGCRCRRSSPRSRWRSSARRSRPRRSRRSSSARSSRSSPGGSRRTSRRSAACRPAGPGRSRSAPGLDDGRLPAAPPPLRPARLDDAVHRARRWPPACLMSRIARDPRGARWSDPRLIGLGLLIGLAALTRNEAIWLGARLGRRGLAGRRSATARAERVRLIAVAGVVAFLVFAPWMLRDWLEFGSPLPGQAVANAFCVTGFDIFAWNDPPTLSRYLAVGPARLVEMRVEGFMHNLFNVLLLPGLPISLIGLAALPWQCARSGRSGRSCVVGAITFLVTSLFFPVATTWGTFLHAAGPIQVLIVLSALLALDAGIARLGAATGLDTARGLARSVARRLRVPPVLGRRSCRRSRPGLARATELYTRARSPAWPGRSEPARRVELARSSPTSRSGWPRPSGSTRWPCPTRPRRTCSTSRAAFPGTRLLVVIGEDHGDWPAVLDADARRDRVLHAGRPRAARGRRRRGSAGGRRACT